MDNKNAKYKEGGKREARKLSKGGKIGKKKSLREAGDEPTFCTGGWKSGPCVSI